MGYGGVTGKKCFDPWTKLEKKSSTWEAWFDSTKKSEGLNYVSAFVYTIMSH